ncbi:hypothetical protein BC941DRAFT_518362 [Chlamydoabsidia padenii]|nr:hypothetical protein BC941DRAFT_518362 [Chlamydoabsidia padenii]
MTVLCLKAIRCTMILLCVWCVKSPVGCRMGCTDKSGCLGDAFMQNRAPFDPWGMNHDVYSLWISCFGFLLVVAYSLHCIVARNDVNDKITFNIYLERRRGIGSASAEPPTAQQTPQSDRTLS